MAKNTNTTTEKTSARAKSTGAPKASSASHRKTKTVATPTPKFTITHDDIATLAFSYWQRRGFQGGSQQEDWDRAERELRSLIS